MNKHEILQLRRECHNLKPVIWLGNQGYTKAVAGEIDCALNAHELIKVKINISDKTARDQLASQLCQSHGAQLIQQIGKTLCLYRRNENTE